MKYHPCEDNDVTSTMDSINEYQVLSCSDQKNNILLWNLILSKKRIEKNSYNSVIQK